MGSEMTAIQDLTSRIEAMKARHGITDEDMRLARKWSAIGEKLRAANDLLPTAQEFADNWAKAWGKAT